MGNMSYAETIAVTESDQNKLKLSEEEAEIVDPHCTAQNPYKVTFQDITSAAFLIKNGIEYTPCTVGNCIEMQISLIILFPFFVFKQKSRFSNKFGMDIYLKKEFLQYTGRWVLCVFVSVIKFKFSLYLTSSTFR